ncbi:hypothetical protein NEOKW01_0246 [Nematocida sp. AWRm80]|nr:hypothetical protein NEOKW01_0246 [Nematocida sp. AWRm80]
MIRSLLVVGRNFRPISPFLTVYLVEEKGFSTREIANKIIPWWLYSMLAFSVIVPMIVNTTGLLLTIILSTVAEVVSYIIMIQLRKRSLGVVILVEICNSFRNSVIVADKRFYGETSKEKVMQYSVIRKITGIVSSFISQNMYYISGSSLSAMYMTILSQMVVLICTTMLPINNTVEVAAPVLMVPIGVLSKILSYIAAFTLINCFKMYIDLILIERTGIISETEGILGMILDKLSFVFYFLSYGIVKILSLLTRTVRIQRSIDRNKAFHGYLEGITKIIAVSLAIPLVMAVKHEYIYTEALGILSWVVQLGSILALQRSKSLFGGYISYMLAFLGFSITQTISYNYINSYSTNHIVTIMSYISGISYGVHAIIDLVARKKKLSPEARFSVYAKLGIGLFLGAGLLSTVDYYFQWKNNKV